MTFRTFFVVVICVTSCCGYQTYQEYIPNGANVPHPCKSNFIWQGVGHKSVLGGSARNLFGEDFAAAKWTWTEELCNADSDDDGRSNGEELGDYNCTWIPGDALPPATNLSHPGVCEPTESAHCVAINSWDIDCSDGDDFTCDGLSDPDTVNVTLKFDKVTVPSDETTYICQKFTIPDDQEYHLFASKPEIDNSHIMHHTIVYGCTIGPPEGFDTPAPCGMSGGRCFSIVSTWVIGQNGECWQNHTGILVGKGHMNTVVVQKHWNNPLQETNYTDESGITLYLTPKLRENNLAYFSTGQEDLVIPPGREAYTVNATCPKSCTTKRVKQPIYVTTSHLHMHYLGASGRLEQWRDGQLISTWLNEAAYSYELPVFNKLPSIELLPGDEIFTVCTFNSMGQTKTTYHGLATSDEMCYGFMSYYPAEAGFTSCDSEGEIDECTLLETMQASKTTTAKPAPVLENEGTALVTQPANLLLISLIYVTYMFQ